jgi:hypothetical protein
MGRANSQHRKKSMSMVMSLMGDWYVEEGIGNWRVVA